MRIRAPDQHNLGREIKDIQIGKAESRIIQNIIM